MAFKFDVRRPLGAAAAGTFLIGALAGAAPAAGGGNVVRVPVWALTPAQIGADCTSQLSRAKTRMNAIAAKATPRTFSGVVLALENVSADISDNLAAESFLFNVSTDAAVRTASQKCQTDIGNFFSEQSARPDIYAALVAAKASHTAKTPADRKLQDLALVAAVRAGAGLDAVKRREFVALGQKLNDLQNTFGANVGNDETTIALPPEQIASLPADFTANFKKDASGNAIIPVNESTYSPFMNNNSDESARKAYYIAYQNRGGQKNVQLLETAIATRDRLAHLLGYPNWAAYVIADRMATTPARVDAFLSNLDTALLPKARAERQQLADLKGSTLNAWDVRFYQNALRKSQYSVDTEAVKQYFPVQHTVDAVLAIYSELLGVKMSRANLPSWNPDVVAYNVADAKSGAYIGSFYLDLFPRPGKYAHFANSGLNARRVLADGTVRAPLNSILGNWPVGAPGKPALLTHDDVLTFFHEFGHNMAAMLATTPYETLNSGFRWDFVEAPSQMLENWVWDPAILKRISSNVTTGAPLPDDLIAKLIKTRHFDEAYNVVGQVALASADLRYHQTQPPFDTTAVWKTTINTLTPNVFVDGTIPQASFTHLMGGYDAGYYGYLWSKVYAQDLFTAFQAAGLTNPAVGARYRADILAPARLLEPDVEVAHFLGRPMRPLAFYQDLNISPPVERHANLPR